MMKTIYKIISVALMAVLVTVSCRNKVEDKLQLEPEVSLTGDTVLDAGSCNLALKLESNSSWTADVDQGWCRISPSRGDAGEFSLYVMADANERNTERSASLTVRSGSFKKRVTLIQKYEGSLTVSSGRIEVPCEGDIISVRVRHNIDIECEVEGDAVEWILPVVTKSMETSVLQFEVVENETMEKREGRIMIHGGDLTETVTVYQSGTAPEIVLSQNEYVVSAEGGDVEVQIRHNVPYSIEVSDSWLSVPPASSTYSPLIRVAANTSGESRTGAVTFVSEEYGLKDFVIIKQLQNGAIVLVEDTYTVSNEGGVLEFPVLANVDFDVVIPDDCNWITLSETSLTRAMEVVGIVLRVASYEGVQPRESEILFVADDVAQSVKIVQTGDTDRQYVYIVFNGNVFAAPLLTGENLSGAYIDWGDGTREEYVTDAVHTYGSSGEYEIMVESEGAEEITISSLKDVSEVSFTYF